MGCTNSSDRNKSKILQNLFKNEQRKVLQLIYDDLASRNPTKCLDKLSFLLFFHKDGYWGNQLFNRFSSSQPILHREQFLIGIGNLFQISQQEKIVQLFQFFEEGSQFGGRGLRFEDLLLVLYNYPKEEFKNVICQQQAFLDGCIKKTKNCGQIAMDNERSNAIKQETTDYDIVSDSQASVDRIPTYLGFGNILMKIRENKQCQPLNVKVQGRQICLQTKKFHTLIRNFAIRIFKEYHLNVKSDRLSISNFTDWIKKHKKLYDSYYSGFHSHIWKHEIYTDENGCVSLIPMYNKVPHDIESEVVYKNRSYLILLNSTLILTQLNDHDRPQEVINLEGLKVTPIQHKKKGYGISIDHRNECYGAKNIYFTDKQTRQQWMKHLKYYKGVDIHKKYILGKKLGIGHFSVVHEAQLKDTNEKYAVKVISTRQVYKNQLEKVMNQCEIMKQLDSPLLIKYKETLETKDYMYLVTELVEGGFEISELMRRKNRVFNEFEVANIARQVILGIMEMHKVGYIHADLKPENVMVIPNSKDVLEYQVKIIDFGLSMNSKVNNVSIIAGTPGYIPVETLDDNVVSVKNDSFALGGIIYFMLTDTVPFSGSNGKSDRLEIENRIRNNALVFDQEKFQNISAEAKEIVQKLTQYDYEQRLSLKDALRHEWFIKTNPENQKLK